MTVDFEPSDGIVFPFPVAQKMRSADFMAEIKGTVVESASVAIWFLGQNSWILKSAEGHLIGIDPYLTDWCGSKDTCIRGPKSRLLPVFIEPEDFDVDVVILTHSHPDHCDPFTMRRLGIKSTACFLVPWHCIAILEDAGIPAKNITLLHPGQSEQVLSVEVIGTFALPTDDTDLNHLGIVVKFSNGKTYYNSGDTAYCELLNSVKKMKPDFMSICINGGYHNLSHWEAAGITPGIGPKTVAPAHFDMMPHNVQPPHMFRKSLWEHDKTIEYVRIPYYSVHYF